MKTKVSKEVLQARLEKRIMSTKPKYQALSFTSIYDSVFIYNKDKRAFGPYKTSRSKLTSELNFEEREKIIKQNVDMGMRRSQFKVANLIDE